MAKPYLNCTLYTVLCTMRSFQRAPGTGHTLSCGLLSVHHLDPRSLNGLVARSGVLNLLRLLTIKPRGPNQGKQQKLRGD